MRIVIIGAGSIGLLFGGYLGKVSPITMMVRRNQQAKIINERGISLINGNEAIVPVTAVTGSERPDGDVYIIAVKQTQLAPLIPYLAVLPKDVSLIFLQNGMGHLEFFEQLPQTNIFVGVVEHGAQKINDYSVAHNGQGITKLAVVRGEIEKVSLLFQMSDFPFKKVENWQGILESKLLANAVINPLTALHGVTNGQLLENSYLTNAAKTVFQEACDVLGRKATEEEWRRIEAIIVKTASNRSSMLQDIDQGLEPEVDAILGYILKRAVAKGADAPVIDFLYQNLKAK